MNSLTKQQIDALEHYKLLMQNYPRLFIQREERLIVNDFAILYRYACETGSVLGVAAATPHYLFVVDLVEPAKERGDRRFYGYSRLINRQRLEGGTNVAVLGIIADSRLDRLGDIVLVRQERHALGTFEYEIPRGFGDFRQTGEDNAFRELEEETGYAGEEAIKLGETLTDTGIEETYLTFREEASCGIRLTDDTGGIPGFGLMLI